MKTSNEKLRKMLRCIQRGTESHWFGNSFSERTLFSFLNLGSGLSPFLLLDCAGFKEFQSTNERHGVGEHPHCGSEPIQEPRVGSGRFVMSTAQEIRQAMADFQNGKMGRLR
jgi:redox-sensitive bicupin YhaK (pirin superfamily)